MQTSIAEVNQAEVHQAEVHQMGTIEGIKVVDVDTHLTEPHDLWTSRAPKGLRESVPQVKDVNGVPTWTFGDTVLGRAGAGGVVKHDGSKSRGSEFIGWSFEQAHPGASAVLPRL